MELLQAQKEIVRLQKMEVDILSKVIRADKTFNWMIFAFGAAIGAILTYLVK